MKKYKLISFDSSTKKTGYCVMENAEMVDYGLLDFSEIDDAEERMREMGKAILKKLKEINPDCVVVEDSWNAMNVDATKKLTRILGVTFSYAISKNIEWHCLLPSQWRKLCGMEQGKKKRNELKQMSIDFVKDKYGISVNDDVADACCIGIGYVNMYSE